MLDESGAVCSRVLNRRSVADAVYLIGIHRVVASQDFGSACCDLPLRCFCRFSIGAGNDRTWTSACRYPALLVDNCRVVQLVGTMTMSNTRPETPADAAVIYSIHSSSFPSEAEARLVDALRAAGRLSVSIVAEQAGEVVGHVAFSPVTAAGATAGAGLGPVAVIERARRRGAGAQLVLAGLAACREAGFPWAVVLGDPSYYGRFGFRPATDFGLSDEYQGGAAFQAIELVDGGLPGGAGLVRYAPEFASLE